MPPTDNNVRPLRFDSSQINPQDQSPLVHAIPSEIRGEILAHVLAPYEDPDPKPTSTITRALNAHSTRHHTKQTLPFYELVDEYTAKHGSCHGPNRSRYFTLLPPGAVLSARLILPNPWRRCKLL